MARYVHVVRPSFVPIVTLFLLAAVVTAAQADWLVAIFFVVMAVAGVQLQQLLERRNR